MTIPMKPIDGVPDRSNAKPGMAYFADTGPFGRTCGQCGHRGRSGRCALFRQMMRGKRGPPVEPQWKACKYFEIKKQSGVRDD